MWTTGEHLHCEYMADLYIKWKCYVYSRNACVVDMCVLNELCMYGRCVYSEHSRYGCMQLNACDV